MRKAVTFNPHWVGNNPAWDIRLLNGHIHRSVIDKDILKVSKRSSPDIVRACDVEDYGRHHLGL